MPAPWEPRRGPSRKRALGLEPGPSRAHSTSARRAHRVSSRGQGTWGADSKFPHPYLRLQLRISGSSRPSPNARQHPAALGWGLITMETGSGEAAPPLTFCDWDSCPSLSQARRHTSLLSTWRPALSRPELLVPPHHPQLLPVPLSLGDESRGAPSQGRFRPGRLPGAPVAVGGPGWGGCGPSA